MTHPIWELAVEKAALVLMPCPGTRQVTLLDSLKQLKQSGVTVIVSAITREEMTAKQVESLGQTAQGLGLGWIHLPIEDNSVPSALFTEHWPTVSVQLRAALKRGNKVALHCMGGSGRTGLLAAHVLLDCGWPLTQCISDIQALRPAAFSSAQQRAYIEQVATSR
ncbi:MULTISPECIES: phosphatase domain-containing putative toxin [Vibrio]|uniref:Dual specificity protein phosphatase family protein n=1 Tax=Vibrio ostreae TaxID=2841925 RepID=A0A975YNB7_9VIBR|nr:MULTISPECIES: dual specificity protein phosphatase family protein [Vibrio]QXO17494.1 dual specificity protein phosphatase family protein [Vibrio ostreae]WGY48195.1 dual specificity protein phosphatase family protein [Vibrio sp. ABG19]